MTDALCRWGFMVSAEDLNSEGHKALPEMPSPGPPRALTFLRCFWPCGKVRGFKISESLSPGGATKNLGDLLHVCPPSLRLIDVSLAVCAAGVSLVQVTLPVRLKLLNLRVQARPA